MYYPYISIIRILEDRFQSYHKRKFSLISLLLHYSIYLTVNQSVLYLQSMHLHQELILHY